VLTFNRKLSKGGAERQGAAPEKGHTQKNNFWDKIPEQLWRWRLRLMPSREAECDTVVSKMQCLERRTVKTRQQ